VGCLIAALFLGSGLFVLLGQAGQHSAGAPSSASSTARVLGESDVWVLPRSASVSWMSEDAVVFIGAPRGADRSLRPSNLYLWRLGAAPKIYAGDRWPRDGGYACAADGVVTYSAVSDRQSDEAGLAVHRSDASGIAMLAPPQSNEAFWARSLEANVAAKGSVSVSGKRCEFFQNDAFLGRKWIANYAKTAAVAFSDSVGEAGFDFLTSGDHGEHFVSTKSLSIAPGSVVPACAETPSWSNSIVLWNCSSGSWDSGNIEMYSISNSGILTVSDINGSSAFRGAAVVPFRDGYLVVNNDGGIEGRGGLFVVRSGRPERILKGSFRPAAMSPSGCKIALFEYEPAPLAYQHLKIVEICEQREGK
jgi:hypothetical protein